MITRKLFRMALAKCRVISLVAAVTPAVPTLAAVVYQNGEVPANGSTISEDTVIEELNLASNMTYTVISTATLTIQNVTGGAFCSIARAVAVESDVVAGLGQLQRDCAADSRSRARYKCSLRHF